MKFFSVEYWPIQFICAGMIAAAVIDWWKFKVPNKLTFPLIFSGWALGLANNFNLGARRNAATAAINALRDLAYEECQVSLSHAPPPLRFCVQQSARRGSPRRS